MTDAHVEARAEVLLRESAARQALVDRLLRPSVWSQFVLTLLTPLATGALFMSLSSLWVPAGSEMAVSIAAGALTGLFVLAIGLGQVNRRLQALTTLLQKSGVFSEFVAGPRSLELPPK